VDDQAETRLRFMQSSAPVTRWDRAPCARSHPITLLAYLAANRRAASPAIGSFLL
jgi:hypothetical protein